MVRNTGKVLICVFALMHLCVIEYSNGYFHLYETMNMVKHRTVHYHDCFYALTSMIATKEMILRPYCIRPVDDDFETKKPIDETQISGEQFTFSQLRQLKVTGEDLYEWSAPINTIEHYQLYLVDSSIQGGVFYNCSSPLWFGTFCQYTLNSLKSFSEIIIKRFQSRYITTNSQEKPEALNITNGTCYVHLKCNRGPLPMCLDWREICDGKCDCINDCVDEESCSELEMNECKEDQYRCSNGMCIPQRLLLDDPDFPDCMDESDEPMPNIFGIQEYYCVTHPNFNCDTLTCSWLGRFSCGSGQCSIYHPPQLSVICAYGRDLLHTMTIFMYNNSSEFSEKCWSAVLCKLFIHLIFHIDCTDARSIENECPPLFFFPSSTVLFNHIRFVYERNRTGQFLPSYICYDEKSCDKFLRPTIFINGSVCKYYHEFPFANTGTVNSFSVYDTVRLFFKQLCPLPGLIITNDGNCSHSALVHCEGSSKCMSKHRLQDRTPDCYNSYDELYNDSCSLNLSHRFHCTSEKKCISQVYVGDANKDCLGEEDELTSNLDCLLSKKCDDKEKIIFSKVCDGFTELSSILIDNQNETDETNCQYWPCHIHYTHCDTVWNCQNGKDELNCSYIFYHHECNDNEHHCVLVNTTLQDYNSDQNDYSDFLASIEGCLPVERAGDKQIDCIGSTDEREYCRSKYPNELNRRFRCWNDTECIDINRVCDRTDDCPFKDDERICPWLKYSFEGHDPSDFFTCMDGLGIGRRSSCGFNSGCNRGEDALICDLSEWNKPERKKFTIGNYFVLYPDMLARKEEQAPTATTALQSKRTSEKGNDLLLHWYCNEGVLVHSFNQTYVCFCPPAYYGTRCQYQNEFIGLIMYIRRKSPRDQSFVFRIVIVLMDNKKNSLFQEQILYITQCEKQYQMYLLYPPRSKLNNLNYSVRLDIYAIHRLQNTIHFRTSLYYTIPFTFLPVNRLIVDLIIPEKLAETRPCNNIQCQNGKCYTYANFNQYYCRCNDGWSGEFCNIRHECYCSPQSLCTETGCVCALGKTGSLCYLREATSCKQVVCKNGGSCVLHDQRMPEQDLKCFCSEEYEGEFCEKPRMRITITFKNIMIPPSILIHFVTTQNSPHPDSLTQFMRISLYQDTAILYPPVQYYIAYAQFDNKYYLIFLNSNSPRQDISTVVIPSNRCPHIRELFNRTTLSFHPLKRIKYYHLLCEQNHHLRCFYDETQMCLCTKDHLTDCFDFDHNGTSPCDESNICENNGKCYINDLICPTKFLCVCKECYHGTLCQFTTSGSVLSLDSIIGYHIQPGISFVKQPFIIKLSMGITIVMLILGIIGNILSIITFSQKKPVEVGCGIYLLLSSILSLVTMIIFAWKFLSLLITQMTLITNEMFLNVNCKLIDFFLKFLPTIVEWLNACVAVERTVNVTLGVNFNKAKVKYGLNLLLKWLF